MGYLALICLLLMIVITAFIEVYSSTMDAMLFMGACMFAFWEVSLRYGG